MSFNAGEKGTTPIDDDRNLSQSNTRTEAGKNKKRNSARQSPEDRHRIEVADRYFKLVHVCSKQLHKDAKIVKSFECQKIVRSIKTAKEAPRTSTRLELLEKRLEQTKKLDLDALVHIGLKRLGIFSLEPAEYDEYNSEFGDSHDKAKQSPPEKTVSVTQSQHEDPFYQALIESMLQHKRLSTCLDQLNEKISEFREWKVSRELLLQGRDNAMDISGYDKKKRKTKLSCASEKSAVVARGSKIRTSGLDLVGHGGASGLFIESLSGVSDFEHDNDHDNCEYDDDTDEMEYYQEVKKKNRPGQRARRAKATAIEARKSGKTWNSSINWREKTRGGDYKRSDKSGQESTSFNDTDIKPTAAQKIATMGKTWKDEGNAHPSWAAKAAQKSQGIVKFAGTKITFD